MRRDLIFMCLAMLAYACSNDDGTNARAGDDAAMRADADNSDVGASNVSSGCLGCTVGEECFNGDKQEHCGSGGAACVACTQTEVCSEAGACVAPPTCGRDTCAGCCDANGACVAGTEATACGVAGLDCALCAAGGTCSGGLCRQPCGPTTCAGCCDAAGACVMGDDDDVCGVGGSACQDCTTSGDACSTGQCVSTACAATCAGCCDGANCIEPSTDSQCGGGGDACVDCRAGRTCGATGCAVDPASNWALFVVSGEVAAMTAEGDSWDGFSGLPDPYVIAIVPNQGSAASEPLDDTLSPQWNETLFPSVPAADLLAGIQFQYRDDDAAFDDAICDIEITLTADSDAFSGGVVVSTCPDAALGNVVWRLFALP